MMNRTLVSGLSVTTLLAFLAVGCSASHDDALEGDPVASTEEALASEPGKVSVGSGECSLLNGVKACYNYVNDTFTCTSGTCVDLSATKSQLACDGANDCGAGQICCFESVYISNQTKCMTPSACKDESAGRYSVKREQVCDTTGECLSGTCQVAEESGSGRYLPAGWSTCR